MKAGECSVMHGRKKDIFATFKRPAIRALQTRNRILQASAVWS
jgi:hypothetical protein